MLAFLLLDKTYGKDILKRIADTISISRACNIFYVRSTQAPNRKILKPEIVLNCNCRVALYCNSAIESRQIINENGAELTAGSDEVRAWPIKNGTPALLAAGKIHSDIQRGFIRAEVIHFDDFIKYGSEAECKKAAAYRLEGKEYVVRDGDIINFRFNV